MLRLQRITSGASWIPQIDGLRFVAIFSVVLFHIGGETTIRGLKYLSYPPSMQWFSWAQGNGDRGVLLFFVISGYILARPFLRQHRLEGHPVILRKYFLRRLTRLEPPYVLSLLLYTLAACTVYHQSFNVLLPHLIASSLYLHNLIYARMSDISFVTYTLEIEVQFYILAPLMGQLYRISDTVTRRGVIASLIVATGIMSLYVSPYLNFTILGNAQFFLAGFLLADLLEYPRHSNRQMWVWDIVSVLGWAAFFAIPRGDGKAWLPWLLVPLCLAAFYGKASNWFFRQRFVAITGGMCYSIYLLHTGVMSGSFRFIKHVQLHTDGETMLVQSLLLLAVILVVSTAYFLLIERPCMDPEWPQKLWHGIRDTGKPKIAAS